MTDKIELGLEEYEIRVGAQSSMKRADQDSLQQQPGLIAFEDKGTKFQLGKTMESKAEKNNPKMCIMVNRALREGSLVRNQCYGSNLYC